MINRLFKKCIYLLCFLFLVSSSLFCQENKNRTDKVLLRGVVVGEEGEPIIGASITEKGTTNGTTTDINGNFQLKVAKGSIILVNYIGMTSKSFNVPDSCLIRINFTQNLLEFCCINHKPSHCATTTKEMQKLTKEKNCSFK